MKEKRQFTKAEIQIGICKSLNLVIKKLEIKTTISYTTFQLDWLKLKYPTALVLVRMWNNLNFQALPVKCINQYHYFCKHFSSIYVKQNRCMPMTQHSNTKAYINSPKGIHKFTKNVLRETVIMQNENKPKVYQQQNA